MSRFMMQPGPTQVDPRVIQATMRPAIHHSDPEFIAEYDRTGELLRPIFGLDAAGEVVMIPASGRGGLEAAATTITDGDRPILVLHTGVFSGMFIEILKSLDIPHAVLDTLPGHTVTHDEIERALLQHRPSVLAVVQAETSTGLAASLDGMGELAHRHDALLMVDCVASLGGVALNMSERGVDIAVAGSQKALGALTGITMLAFSRRAIDTIRARPDGVARSYYFDLARWWKTWLPRERGGDQALGARRMPWSMNTHGIFALQRACELALFDETLERRYARHHRVARGFQAAVEHLGFRFLDVPERRADTVSVFTPPAGVAAGELIAVLGRTHNIAAAGGLGAWSGQVIRVGHMAETARELVAETTVLALGDAMHRLGALVPGGADRVFWDVCERTEAGEGPTGSTQKVAIDA